MFAFTGLIRCGGCQGAVTAEEKHQLICSICKLKFAHRSKEQCPRCKTAIIGMVNPLRLSYTYYHCARSSIPRCMERGVERKDMERQIIRSLERVRLPDFHQRWFNTCFGRLREKPDASDALLTITQSFSANTPAVQREIAMSVFSTLILKDRNLDASLKAPFSFVGETEKAASFDQEPFARKTLQEEVAGTGRLVAQG